MQAAVLAECNLYLADQIFSLLSARYTERRFVDRFVNRYLARFEDRFVGHFVGRFEGRAAYLSLC